MKGLKKSGKKILENKFNCQSDFHHQMESDFSTANQKLREMEIGVLTHFYVLGASAGGI